MIPQFLSSPEVLDLMQAWADKSRAANPDRATRVASDHACMLYLAERYEDSVAVLSTIEGKPDGLALKRWRVDGKDLRQLQKRMAEAEAAKAEGF